MKELEFIQTENFEANIDRYGYNENTCECCGKQLKNKKWAVNTLEGPTVIEANITDEEIEASGLYSQGLFYLGSDCIKKYPKEFRVKLK
jgi:hypothetical protein